jgi:PKD repeat protein
VRANGFVEGGGTDLLGFVKVRRRAPVLALAAAASLGFAASAPAGEGNDNNKKPQACFTQSVPSPQTSQTVTFDSTCSTDKDGRVTGRAWDLDGDGQFDDGTDVTATHAWTVPGRYTVRLAVIDNSGDYATTTKSVTVANRGPVAGFSFSPAEPVAGQTVTLTSTATDSDGTIETLAWDLNNDGRFDDAGGATASFTPPAAGSYPVALRVVDDRGANATASKTFVVAERPADPPPPTSAPAQQFDDSLTTSPEPPQTAPLAPLRWLDPFPVVRIRGRATRTGVVLSLFTVRAPAGSRVELRCSGRGCPTHVVRRRVTTRTGKPAATVRIKALERRLPVGTRLQVKITQPGLVGKYTRFKIRRLKVPVRTDRCLMPGSGRPVACPEAP